ncbi:hypothetical protein ABGV42_01235 [Paenibacillus pabuli]|uniref:hypothetical protein n=1 Tax=Paenibacillus pabuli TaxID=1472 RepID=UPI0032427C31
MSSYHVIGSTLDCITVEVENRFVNKAEYNKFYEAFMEMQSTYCYFGDIELPIKIALNYDNESGLEVRFNFINWSGYDFLSNMDKVRCFIPQDTVLCAEGTAYDYEYYSDGQYGVLRFVSDVELDTNFNIEYEVAHYEKSMGYFEEQYFKRAQGIPKSVNIYRILTAMNHYVYNAFYKSQIDFGFYLSDEGKFLDIVALRPKAN